MACGAYYNEIEPFAAQWLRKLIAANLIAPGDVDERSIRDVQPTDLRGYRQCHFFAGIGVWSHALRLAGWPDDREAWTGSCPCQPFSVAGSQLGTADERHLWPEFFRLIRECRPPVVIGEQVAGPAALAWFDLVSADLEGAGYAVGAADLCAASLGAPHIRQRLYWVGHAGRTRSWRDAGAVPGTEAQGGGERRRTRGVADEPIASGPTLGMANSRRSPGRTEQLDEPRQGLRREPGQADCAGIGECGEAGAMADATPRGQRIDGGAPRDAGHAPQCEPACDVANAECNGSGSWRPGGADGPAEVESDRHGATGRMGDASQAGQPWPRENDGGCWNSDTPHRPDASGPRALGGFWENAHWLHCTDGKARPVEPQSEPLADGAAGSLGLVRATGYPPYEDQEVVFFAPLIAGGKSRAARLRGYGNALCEPVAQEFIEIVMECCQ